MPDSFDAVVIGSGFGGGITACRLAIAGWKVCVLERGRRFAREDFISEASQAPQAFWHPTLNPDGIFDLRLFKDIVVLTAAGVGGGSLVYANVQLRANPEVFESGWPSEITRAALDPYYDRVESVLEPVPTPPVPPISRIRAFRNMAEAAGEQPTALPIAVHFGEDRLNPFGGVPQSGCENLTRCDIGCPLHAKNTIDLNYLARAEREGADVRTKREVRRLDPPTTNGGRWRVSYRGLGDAGDGEVTAPVVVLGAGTLGTTRLLLQNRRRLSGLSPALGTHFSSNGDALGAALSPRAPSVQNAHTDFGPAMTTRIDYWTRHRFMVADGALPTPFLGLIKILRDEAVLDSWGRRLLLRIKDLAARLGLGDRILSPKDIVPNLDTNEPIDDSLVFLMLGQDAANGRMRLTPLFRRFDIQWNSRRSQPLFDAMKETTDQLAQAADADPYFALGNGPLGKEITVHPLGGCPMADDPSAGVVDAHGRVYGHPGLHISDGSIVPTAIGVNPSQTIAALAERNVEYLVSDGSP
jgi:cholesterol oxidase